MIKIILFDEKAKEIIPGIYGDYSFLKMPIGGNYNLKSFVDLIISLYDGMGLDTIIVEWENNERLFEVLESGNLDGCFMSRASSLVWSEIRDIKRYNDGPIKISINKTPTDLYYLPRKYFKDFLKKIPKMNTVQDIFKNYFFNSFVKITDREGFVLLMRNAYEYYRENMKTIKYLKDKRILSILSKVPALSENGAYIGGSVKNSYIAPGSNILGNVSNSVIYKDVEIAEGSYVESSVILPGNRLEEEVVIRNSLILEGSTRTIGKGSIIGEYSDEDVKLNHSFILKNGLTVIGEGINIPDYSNIGSYCVVEGKGSPSERLIIEKGNYLLIDGE